MHLLQVKKNLLNPLNVVQKLRTVVLTIYFLSLLSQDHKLIIY